MPFGAVIGLQDPARQDRAIGLQTLADHDQAELIQAAERGQVRAAEGSVRFESHVHVRSLHEACVATRAG